VRALYAVQCVHSPIECEAFRIHGRAPRGRLREACRDRPQAFAPMQQRECELVRECRGDAAYPVRQLGKVSRRKDASSSSLSAKHLNHRVAVIDLLDAPSPDPQRVYASRVRRLYCGPESRLLVLAAGQFEEPKIEAELDMQDTRARVGAASHPAFAI
jgi:hypothetical protein